MPWSLSLSGLLVGFLVGATGMGGGSLMTPILVLVFGYSPTVAVGTDIVHGAIFKSFGALRHRRLGTVHGRLSGWMFLGSAPASLGGVALATWVRHRYGDPSAVGKPVLGAVLIVGALGMIAKLVMQPRERLPEDFRLGRRDRIAAVAIGLFGGFIVGLTSVGTGVFFGLTMLIAFPLRSAKVVGTDVFHAAALLWVAGAGHIVAGNVRLGTVGWLLLGSIPGVLVGAQVTVRVSGSVLRLLLAAVLVAVGFLMSGWLIAVLTAAPAALIAGAVAVRRRMRLPSGSRPSPDARPPQLATASPARTPAPRDWPRG